MHHSLGVGLVVSLFALPAPVAAAPAAAKTQVEVVTVEAEKRVDVRVAGQPFTTYRWDPKLAKPVLHPVHSAGGKAITRGFPLTPIAGESEDHPHHIGLWFNYGDVAGADFWGNSAALRGKPAGERHGTIVHRKIESARGGPGRGELIVTADWVMPDGKANVSERTQYVFTAAAGRRAIDRVATLTPTAGAVKLPDNKEGMLALRLGRALEHPGRKNPDGTGHYRSSEGKEGDDVWGTRARWVMLTGKLEGAPITIAILDHPSNPGHPTYWHARGYGLFAANPLGQKSLSKGKETLDFTLPAGKPTRFSYRVLVLDEAATPAAIEAEYQRFAADRR